MIKETIVCLAAVVGMVGTAYAGDHVVTLEQSQNNTRVGLRMPNLGLGIKNLGYEVAVSHWYPSGDILEFTPTYRLQINEHWYVDGAFGVSVSDSTTVGGRTSSTLFNFTEGVCGGYAKGSWEVGACIRHYSNGGAILGFDQNPGHEAVPSVHVGWKF